MLEAAWQKKDRKAFLLIISFSAIVFTAIVLLSRYQLKADLGFDVHYFALFNAVVNSMVTILLIVALIAVKKQQYKAHRAIMITAMMLSVLFLLSYICHHLFAGDTMFGDVDHNKVVSEAEKAAVGSKRIFYYIILGTHIPLAGIILPFVLFTAYRGMIGEWQRHRWLARITWPIWLYVAITGVVVYLMISPYYY